MALSNSEEQLMQILWKQKRAFMKDLIDAYPDPKPAPTTVAQATLKARRMTSDRFKAPLSLQQR